MKRIANSDVVSCTNPASVPANWLQHKPDYYCDANAAKLMLGSKWNSEVVTAVKHYCKKTCGACDKDCVESKWGAFSSCSKQCGEGTQTRTRLIVSAAVANGKKCGPLRETQK